MLARGAARRHDTVQARKARYALAQLRWRAMSSGILLLLEV